MRRNCIGQAISGLGRKCLNPYLLLLPLVAFLVYTLHNLLILTHSQNEGDRKYNIPPASPMQLDQESLTRGPDFAAQLRKDFREARKFVKVYNVTEKYEADFRCVTMKTRPATPVCVYDAWTDMYISHDLIETGVWEGHVLYDFQEDLKRDNSLGVIDIGANIGVYTLLAANMGRKVVAIEPLKDNILRLHRSAVLAGSTKRIVVLENAVSNKRSVATIRGSGNNQGDTRIVMGYEPCLGSCPQKINTILISDLRFVMTFDRAIMKVDIQGYEHLAFEHIETLLDSVYIPYIYMEWLVMKKHGNKENIEEKLQGRTQWESSSIDKEKVENMIKILYRRKYRPHSLTKDGATELGAGSWQSWPLDIVWRHLPSTIEYKKLIKNHFMVWPAI